MIKTRKELRECLKYEKRRYGKINRFWFILAFFRFPESSIIWKYQRILRKWEYHLNNNHKVRALLKQISAIRLGNKYGLSLHPNVFDVGLKIMHLGSIIVNGEARVGRDCSIHINTALVATGGVSDSPKIGNNCKIGIGATLVGGITLGDDVVIGAGAVVTKSFEENHITLGGVPAKIISRNAIM